GTNRYGAIDIQSVIIFRAHVHGHADRRILVYGIAQGISRIVSDKGLDIVVAPVIEQDDIDGAAFFERLRVREVDVVADLRLEIGVAGGNILWIAGIDVGVQPPVV